MHDCKQFFIQKHLRQFEWTMTVQAVSFCIVDMIRKKLHIRLIKIIEGASFFSYIPDILMILFTTALKENGQKEP